MPGNYDNLTIVIPAYNEADTIAEVVKELKSGLSEVPVIVVDDASTDDTGKRAADAGADKVIRHKTNRGYGAGIKSGARAAETEFIATYDADGQHDPASLRKILEVRGDYDMVIGARSTRNQNLSRLFGKKILFSVANMLAGEKIPDLNSGLRVFRREYLLQYIHILPDGFSLSTTITLAMLKDHLDVHFEPVNVKVRGGGRSTVRFLRDGYRTFILILRIIMLFDPLKVFLPISFLFGIIGGVYGLIWLVLYQNIPDGAILLIISSITFFLFGLLADQISSILRHFKPR